MFDDVLNVVQVCLMMCLVLYRCVWCCTGVFGFVQVCLVLYRCVWCCTGVFDDVFGVVQVCLVLCRRV